MSSDHLVLLYSFLGLLVTTSLICLNNVRHDAEKRMKEPVDFLSYLKQKAEGDEVDRLILQKIEIKDIAA
tara:strand:- start:227 stop:436 length:210 start_codon:yes stop_codon:yes gene_type:complete